MAVSDPTNILKLSSSLFLSRTTQFSIKSGVVGGIKAIDSEFAEACKTFGLKISAYPDVIAVLLADVENSISNFKR